MAKYTLLREPESDELVREIRIIQQDSVISRVTLEGLLEKGWERIGEIEVNNDVTPGGLRRGLSAAATRKLYKAHDIFQQIANLTEDGQLETGSC